MSVEDHRNARRMCVQHTGDTVQIELHHLIVNIDIVLIGVEGW